MVANDLNAKVTYSVAEWTILIHCLLKGDKQSKAWASDIRKQLVANGVEPVIKA